MNVIDNRKFKHFPYLKRKKKLFEEDIVIIDRAPLKKTLDYVIRNCRKDSVKRFEKKDITSDVVALAAATGGFFSKEGENDLKVRVQLVLRDLVDNGQIERIGIGFYKTKV